MKEKINAGGKNKSKNYVVDIVLLGGKCAYGNKRGDKEGKRKAFFTLFPKTV